MSNIDIGTKYLIIDKLDYETLSKIFYTNVLYETNHIIIKYKNFSREEIDKALEEHSKTLANIYSLSPDTDDLEEYILDYRGKIIDMLAEMSSYDAEDSASVIRETLMLEQIKIDGLKRNIRGFCNQNSKYFNPDARIDVQFI